MYQHCSTKVGLVSENKNRVEDKSFSPQLSDDLSLQVQTKAITKARRQECLSLTNNMTVFDSLNCYSKNYGQ